MNKKEMKRNVTPYILLIGLMIIRFLLVRSFLKQKSTKKMIKPVIITFRPKLPGASKVIH